MDVLHARNPYVFPCKSKLAFVGINFLQVLENFLVIFVLFIVDNFPFANDFLAKPDKFCILTSKGVCTRAGKN